MAQTLKNINDSLFELLTRFHRSDESRIDETWMNYKIHQVRAQLIVAQYSNTNQIDPSWLSPPMPITFHRTNFSDNQSINDSCIVSKGAIPQTISIINPMTNIDLGVFRLVSMKGRTQYYFKRSFQWEFCPPEHTNSLFKYYDRTGSTQVIINDDATQLLLTPILLNPEDGYIRNSTPIASGSLVSGTVYKVIGSQIVYNSVVVAPNATFTANATTTFGGQGLVYLNSEASAIRDVDPYPASGDMIRQIELEILTKEFGIEMKQLTDVRNDSIDDANKVPAV